VMNTLLSSTTSYVADSKGSVNTTRQTKVLLL